MDAERWKRVDDLLQSALQEPADRQEEFLRRACGTDANLLQEVQSLLKAHQSAGDFLERPAIQVAAQAVASGTAPASSHSFVGQTVSHYRVLSQVGAGGMGVVYRAEDIKLGRRVALKFLPGELATDRIAFERLQREARASSALDHPNICSIYELGEHEGQPFIVMQLLEGQTLREWIESVSTEGTKKAAKLRVNRALDFAIQLAEGLRAAHEKGIIHRDIKPANIFVTTRGDPKILDFGLAKVLEEHPAREIHSDRTATNVAAVTNDLAATHLTRTGATAGTTYYMSPEQVRGEKLDARTDLFSLGLVMYEMVTAQRAFAGETGAAVYEAILQRTPEPVRKLNPEVPAEFERIINKAIEKDRSRRYQSAKELENDLQALREELRPSVLWKSRKFLVGVAALLALAVGLGMLLQRFSQPAARESGTAIQARRSVAVFGFDNLSGSSDTDWLSTGLSQMFATELAAGGKLRIIPLENVARAKTELRISEAGVLSKYNLERLRKNLGTDVVILGSYTVRPGGEMHLDVQIQNAATGESIANLSQTGNDQKLFDLVALTGAEIREKLGTGAAPAAEESSVKASLPANPEAARLYSQGLEKIRSYNFLEARDLLLKASEIDPQHAGTHSALAESWRGLGYDAEAQTEAEKSVDLSADLSREDRLWYQGRSYEIRHQWDKATSAYRTLLQLYPDGLEYGLRLVSAQIEGGNARDGLATVQQLRKLPPPFGDDPRIDISEANADLRLGQPKPALALALQAEQKARAQEVTLVAARAIGSRCDALHGLGQLKEAASACDEAYRIYIDAGDRGRAAAALNTISVTMEDEGDLVGSKSKAEEALAIANKTGDKRSQARYINNLALTLWSMGNLAEAEQNYERSLKIALEVQDKIGATNTLGNMGLVLVAMEDFRGARLKYEAALGLAREIGNKTAEASNQIHLAELFYLQGDLAGITSALNAADKLLDGTGDKRHHLYTLFSWGDLLFVQDNLPEAHKKLQEALDTSKQMGSKDLVAYSQMVLANLATEEGRAGDAVVLAKAATDEYEAEKSADFEVQALDDLTSALLADGKSAEANEAVGRARKLLLTVKDPLIHNEMTIVSARAETALGSPAQAIPPLRLVIADTHRHGVVGDEFEARLALGEAELKAGSVKTGRADLERLEKDARGRGYLLIARKAHTAANSQSHS